MDENIVAGAGWQLLVEVSATSTSEDARHLAEQLLEAVQKIGLPHLPLAWIQEALFQAVRRATLSAQPAGAVASVRIRIWTASEFACGRGWGFFLVEKPGRAPVGAVEPAESLVELFLYQETPLSVKHRRPLD